MKRSTRFFILVISLLFNAALFASTVHSAGAITPDSSANCHAVFTSSHDTNASSLTIHFLDQSTGNYTSLLWDFGDGTPAGTTHDPHHSYATPGLYNVCLTITGDSCQDVTCHTISAGNTSGCHATFIHSSDSGSVPQPVHFWDQSTGVYTSRIWQFDDPASGTANTSTLVDPWHYFFPGVYHVCLTIYGDSCQDMTCEEVIIAGTSGCHAAFIYSPDSLGGNLSVHFWDQSTGNYSSRLWDFGDPSSGIMNTSTTPDPHHVFTVAGNYNVCLTIQGDSCENTTCQEIVVGESNYNCENSITYATNFLTVTFEGHTNSPYPTTYTWHMSDTGSVYLTGKNVIYTYPSAGSYTVTLTTVDSLGCSWTRTLEIYLHATCDLWGYVRAGDHYADHGYVYLLKNDQGVITMKDTTMVTDSSGMYWFGGVLPGHYYVKAELTSNSVYFNDYIPTYYEHAANWTTANLIELGQPDNPYSIHLIAAPGYGEGPGLINGTITQDARVSNYGSSAPNVEVLILDADNLPLTYVLTDENGLFSFPDVALGHYTIYPEIAGKQTTPAIVTLSITNPTANVDFTVHEGTVVFGINDNLPKFMNSIGDVYPNPVSGQGSILINVSRNLPVTLTITNITGQQVKEINNNLRKGNNVLNFDRSGMESGYYFLKIRSSEGGSVVKKFIINK
ncbi:MAG: PKD domain-containing protein [Bacteroidetes bacterium]|nr:PKD domain-containing protein [Bacteroidota bacterium]